MVVWQYFGYGDGEGVVWSKVKSRGGPVELFREGEREGGGARCAWGVVFDKVDGWVMVI